jgi:hypothetical protein
MAVELPAPPREIPVAGPISVAGYAPLGVPSHLSARVAHEPWSPRIIRFLEIIPGAVALILISSLVWGYLWFPQEIAVGLLIFDVYWLWKSWTIAYHVMKGERIIRRHQSTDWRAEYERVAATALRVLPWEAVKHVVIIPNYKESAEKLRQTLQAMAETAGARESVIPVLAMEDCEPGVAEKAKLLAAEFDGRFFDLLMTFHPYGLPGEVRGKSSNQAWGARCAVEELVGYRGIDIDHLTVTSCDADTIFPQQYFECLTFHFATDPARHRRFWQAPIFFYNNIWQVPAPLRVPNALAGLIHLSRLSRKRKVLFSQSTYSLSMRMCHDVGYWDTDVIPEDWHMFLKCFYRLGGTVDVRPIHLPIGNDGALSHTPRETFVNQYLQVRRWAWGAVDIPYAIQEMFRRQEIPFLRRIGRAWYIFENHITWSTQWFFITLGGFIPTCYWLITGVEVIPQWFYIDNLFGGTFLPGWLTITTIILTPCLICYLILITTDARMRPPAPRSFTRFRHAIGLVQWLAIPPITFFFSCLPALDSQLRLMIGKRMEYRVTEKV